MQSSYHDRQHGNHIHSSTRLFGSKNLCLQDLSLKLSERALFSTLHENMHALRACYAPSHVFALTLILNSQPLGVISEKPPHVLQSRTSHKNTPHPRTTCHVFNEICIASTAQKVTFFICTYSLNEEEGKSANSRSPHHNVSRAVNTL